MNATTQFIRQRIDYENNLINQRIASLVGSQAFFVTGFTISLNAPMQLRSAQYDEVHRVLTWMLPIAGISIVVMVIVTVVAAIMALHTLYQEASRHHAPEDPPIHSNRMIRWMGYSASLGIPAIFLILWCTLIFTINHNPL